MTYPLERIDKWLGAILSTIPKIQLWGKATEEADTAVLVDSDGHLQVDMLTGGLPTGAATENTIQSLYNMVEAMSDGDYLLTGLYPRTAGGLSIFRSIDLDETEEEVKGSAGMVYGMIIRVNTVASTIRYIKFYDGTAATVVVGTTTPVMTIPVNGADTKFFSIPQGLVFSNGITVAATTGLADNDTGAPAANVIQVNAFYK